MLAKDEFDARVGQALASRTYADLAALTAASCPPRPQPGWRARLPRSAVGRWSGRPPSRAPAWSSQPLPCGAPPSSIRVPTSQVTVVAGLPWCCSSPFAPCWLHSASWRAGWSSHGSKDAPAGSCHPGRGGRPRPRRRTARRHRPGPGFPRTPHRPHPRRPAGPPATAAPAAHSRPGGRAPGGVRSAPGTV
jgi:hypothetical protein